MNTHFRPLGTLKSSRQEHAASSYERSLSALASVAPDFQLAPSAVWLAHDIATLQNELEDFSASERLATTLLVVLALYAQNQGSTYVPLTYGADGYIHSTLQKFAGHLAEVTKDDSGETATRLLNADELTTTIEELMDNRLAHIVGTPGDYKPLIADGARLYIEKVRVNEKSVVAALLERLDRKLEQAPAREKLASAIEDVLDHSPYGPQEDPIERQRRSDLLTAAAKRALTVVSGGPGTGKTSVIVAVMRTLTRLGLDPAEIALAAPTGKAAKRMRESMEDQFGRLGDNVAEGDATLQDALGDRLEPQTLHRLLDYSPYHNAFRRNADSPLEHRAVIVDEVSMIDLELMGYFLAAVKSEARLILVGDADQLPSVGAGTVFADLSARDAACAHRLVKNYRAEGEAILTTAKAVNKGTMPSLDSYSSLDELAEKWHERAGSSDFAEGSEVPSPPRPPEGVWSICLNHPKALFEFLDHWYARFVDLRPLFGAAEELTAQGLPYRRQKLQSPFVQRLPEEGGGFTDEAIALLDTLFKFYAHSRLLCLTRVRKHGADRVNRLMHRRFKELHGLRSQARFHAGEPVMVLSNDYELDLFNGDQGIVLYTRFDERNNKGRPTDYANKRVVFPATGGGYRAVDLDRIRDRIELSYAMTVHKSQGSEFNHVAMLLPDKQIPLSTREIIYTGITRAKYSVTLFGAKERLEEAVSNPTQRFTGVGEALAEWQRETADGQPAVGVGAEPSVQT